MSDRHVVVGYIVGLGDRHAQNILIDKATAEMVHIDLGVAFEQGKTLRTPEVVPFRLTRGMYTCSYTLQQTNIIGANIHNCFFLDIIDGMGIMGYEGVFRRCCEQTMKVLRDNHASLLTILEVFIHDPLYRWALSPLQALRLQRDETEVEDGLEDVEITGKRHQIMWIGHPLTYMTYRRKRKQ